MLGVIDGAGMLGRGGNPDLDSHVRYLSGLLPGIGIAFLSLIPDTEMQSAKITLLCSIVVVGGLARFYGIRSMGPSPRCVSLIMDWLVPCLGVATEAGEIIAMIRSAKIDVNSSMLTSDGLKPDAAARSSPRSVAFAKVYQATSAKLYGIVLRILRRRDIADEVLQEVYVKIWERAPISMPKRLRQYRGWPRSRAIARLMKYAASNRLRSRIIPKFRTLHPTMRTALAAVMRGEDGRRLAECLKGLEPDRCQMVVFAYCEGLSRDSLPRNTVSRSTQ